jgi:hypothetical protein
MHIYAYGSICRGEITPESDIDLLVVDPFPGLNFDPQSYSFYSRDRVAALWQEGNPFAWHLHLEARELYSSDGQNYIESLGVPHAYRNVGRDCKGLLELFEQARNSLAEDSGTRVFDLSSIFLSMRNIATCYLLGVRGTPDFSRSSALHLGRESVPIPRSSYQILERARILCTRGYGPAITAAEVDTVIAQLGPLEEWIRFIAGEAGEK